MNTPEGQQSPEQDSSRSTTECISLPFPLEQLRGRRVTCSCGNVLAVWRRRRFYPLVPPRDTGTYLFLVCPGCGRTYPLAELLAHSDPRRRPSR